MKKIIAWMLTIVMLVTSVAILIPIYSAYAAADYSVIKVRISTGTPATHSIKIIGSFVMEEDKSFALPPGSATIKNSGGKLTITAGGKSKTVSGTITLLNGDTNSKKNLIQMKGYNSTNQYLGDMIFQASGSGITATNRLPLEQYVIGVIAMEMGSSFKKEALKAQAVAARSYAVTYINKRKNNAYHILDGPSEQAYIGYKTTAVLNEAANETAGQLMLYNGKVIEAFYSAANGGQTDKASNSWGGGDAKDKAYPYFAIVNDPYDLKIAATKGHEEKVFIPQNLKGNQSKANAAIWGDIMEAFGLSRSIGEGSLSGAKINSASYTKATNKTGDTREYKGVTFNVTVNGKTKSVYIDLTKLSSRKVFTKTHLRMKSCEEGTKDGVKGWYLTNRRYGHGVGLSQWGAQEMASQGKGYRDILSFYYRGVSLNTSDTGTGWTNEGEGTGMVDSEGNKITGWHEADGSVYYMDPTTGAMAKGWKKIENNWYFFDKSSGVRQKDWLKDGSNWYYLDPATGIMKINEAAEIDGKIYVFNGSGYLQKSKWYKAGGEWYYLNSSGVALKQWQKLGGVWYYFDTQTARMLVGTHTIEGSVYVFSSSGAMQAKKWYKDGNDWYYLKSAGTATKGWMKEKGVWYYFDNQTAKMLTGVHTIDGEVYAFRASGSMVANGWSKQGDTWYYLKGSGAAVKGWKSVGGKWYYFSHADAKMQTGAIDDNGTVYVLGGSGAMLTGWQDAGGNRYYLAGNGAAAKGWQDIAGKKYYFDATTAAMAKGEKKIDGVVQLFGNDGVYTGPKPEEAKVQTTGAQAPAPSTQPTATPEATQPEQTPEQTPEVQVTAEPEQTGTENQ